MPSLLDQFAPRWQFHEVHRITVDAGPSQTYAAVRAVTAREIRWFRALTWMRRLGRAGPAGILNPPPDEPVLSVATRTGFLALGEQPDREIAVGIVVIAPPGEPRPATPAAFRACDGPGRVKAVMNFRIEPHGAARSVVTTETRVYAGDAAARRRFALYWLWVRPGSGWIRRMWLRAIKRRAEI